MDYYGATLHAGRDGIIEGITIDEIGGEWSDEYYHYGNNGRSSVLELSFEVEGCDSFRFYLEAGGLHGAKGMESGKSMSGTTATGNLYRISITQSQMDILT